jgi:hypothetical protein
LPNNNFNPNSPFAHLAGRIRGQKTNSTPNNSFATKSNPRVEFERAEAQLKIARENMVAATRAAGKSTEGLFKDSRFILRTSGEKWVYQAEEAFLEREQRNYEYVAIAIEKLGPHIPNPTATARKIISASKKANTPAASPPLPTNTTAQKIILQQQMAQGRTKEIREKAARDYEKLNRD